MASCFGGDGRLRVYAPTCLSMTYFLRPEQSPTTATLRAFTLKSCSGVEMGVSQQVVEEQDPGYP